MEHSIDRAVRYIAKNQLQNGGFTAWRSVAAQQFAESKPYFITFFSSLIAGSLKNIDHPVAQKVTRRVNDYLQTQMRPSGLWNYWDTTSEFVLPEDLDDTVCALLTDDPKSLSGVELARFVSALIANESAEGGPYYTWCVTDNHRSHWNDIDPVVNANIGFFMRNLGVELPNIEKYLLKSAPTSQFYKSNPVLYYFVSRYSTNVYSLKTILNCKAQNPLEEAMLVMTLLNYGYDRAQLTKRVARLVEAQATDGSWSAAAIYVDAHSNGSPAFAGAPWLTTAFCAEALSFYQQDLPATKVVPSKSVRVVSAVIDRQKSSELKAMLFKLKQDTLTGSQHRNITAMPQIVAHAIGYDISDTDALRLQLISQWGWMAYTAADDIADGDRSVMYMPALLFCLRQLHKTLSSELNVAELFDAMDAANSWEQYYCRMGSELNIAKLPDYGDYSQLADRSIGHMIAGLGVLQLAGFSEQSHKVRTYKKFFHNYLIARQLNDDAHDWEDDFSKGHLTAVVVLILKDAGTHDLATLRSVMWNSTILKVNNLIRNHLATARKAIEGEMDDLAELLTPIERSVESSDLERKRALDFINGLAL